MKGQAGIGTASNVCPCLGVRIISKLWYMKYLFILLLSLFILNIACRKTGDDCSIVTITNNAPGCGGWGIVVNGVKYPSRNIPAIYQQPGIFVCTKYELYDDMMLCACCGGKWANIISMTYHSD